MGILRKVINIATKGEGDMIDITGQIAEAVHASKDARISQGLACVFVSHSTAALFTIEYEPGLRSDMNAALERTFPKNIEYEHHKRWGDHNGHSHIKASFIGPSLTIPFNDGALDLGTWQQVVLMELDVSGRDRKIIIQIVGD